MRILAGLFLLSVATLPAGRSAALPDPVLAPRIYRLAAINTVKFDETGGIFVGGQFRAVQSEPRRHAVRLRPDGFADG